MTSRVQHQAESFNDTQPRPLEAGPFHVLEAHLVLEGHAMAQWTQVSHCSTMGVGVTRSARLGSVCEVDTQNLMDR